MEAEVFPQEQVGKFITQNFIPVKIHVKERPKDFERFKAQWTPTAIVAEPDGTERYRFEGFLPVDDYVAHLQLGLAKAAFSRGEFDVAAKAFRAAATAHPVSEVAPEAIYWEGVSKYKATGKPEGLQEAGQELRQKYPASTWAKKGSVYAGTARATQ